MLKLCMRWDQHLLDDGRFDRASVSSSSDLKRERISDGRNAGRLWTPIERSPLSANSEHWRTSCVAASRLAAFV